MTSDKDEAADPVSPPPISRMVFERAEAPVAPPITAYIPPPARTVPPSIPQATVTAATAYEHAVSEAELGKARDRYIAQRDKAGETVSTTLRTIGTGLAAVTYSFVFAATQSPELARERFWLFCASAAGSLAIVFDVIQGFLDRHSAQATLDFLKRERQADRMPSPPAIEAVKKKAGGRWSGPSLYLRAAIISFGLLFLFVAIWHSMTPIPQPGSE